MLLYRRIDLRDGHTKYEPIEGPPTELPKLDGDYLLPLLVATKQSLFRCMADPELEDARAVLSAIDESLKQLAVVKRG